MKDYIVNADGRIIVDRLIGKIHENREYLSEIDGRIGDGDHGINMDKGFQLTGTRLEDGMSMSDAFRTLGRTLLLEIGGSMGPLYGQFFKALAKVSEGKDEITAASWVEMLDAGYEAIRDLGEAKPGDKTLVDTLDPAIAALREAVERRLPLDKSMDAMLGAAREGWKSTEGMVAKVGRSSRLGERSRGVLDAGATSCYLLLETIADTVKEIAA